MHCVMTLPAYRQTDRFNQIFVGTYISSLLIINCSVGTYTVKMFSLLGDLGLDGSSYAWLINQFNHFASRFFCDINNA